ncbi:uncharacterized protein [Littorina saxatilis]|uniref:uncharacterized protein n=1 Tax=Littorina saxatilis TaxID=31220 RepID=UPI0038B5BA64
MDLLESRNAELKKQNESLQKKLTMIDDRHKMLKMKTELLSGEIPPTRNKTEEELKRIIYLQEKDLTAMERELLSQQRVFYTVLCGIKTDLFVVGESLSDPDTGQIPSKDFVRLTGMVETLATAMADGDIEPARKDLPPHYTYLPANFKVKRIKRVSNLSGNKLPPIHGSEPRSLENTDTDTNGTNNGMEYFVDTIEANPVLVDPNTDSVHFMTCMKHFPHLSMEFVKEHWIRFKEFDANGDQSLDFSEVVRALTAMGLKFNAHQAEEAMREADVNHSHTLDFFEYVLVVDKLIHRTGRSELFHAAPQDRKVLSKTCVVQ